MRRLTLPILAVLLVALLTTRSSLAAPSEPSSASHRDLVALFEAWREFEQPRLLDGAPDYTAPTMAAKHIALKAFQARMAAIDPTGWPIEQQVDYQLVRAEMNGLDFNLRVLRPWARDPASTPRCGPSRVTPPPTKGQPIMHWWSFGPTLFHSPPRLLPSSPPR
jgi:hypothetical protein